MTPMVGVEEVEAVEEETMDQILRLPLALEMTTATRTRRRSVDGIVDVFAVCQRLETVFLRPAPAPRESGRPRDLVDQNRELVVEGCKGGRRRGARGRGVVQALGDGPF